jgi:TetR/AcrR family transcriptional regulator, transcriptional repressor for nem operon
MRYAPGRKEQTRAKILEAAGKVFRRDGYQAAGVDKVMEEAGLTAGGFYAHFASKEALLAEILAPAATEAAIPLDQGLDRTTGPARAEAYLDRYLSESHRCKPEHGCPLPALVSEVARSGETVKASFEAIVLDFAAKLQGHAGADLTEGRALAIVALCVGGLGIARAVQDEALGDRILAACRDLAREALAADLPAPVTPPRKRKAE